MQNRKLNLQIPIIQGGMGIGISLGKLAGTVAKHGGMGVISSINPGYNNPDFLTSPGKTNEESFRKEIQRAKKIAKGNGMIATNIMVATSSYEHMIQVAVEEGIDAIISGAGLPLNLPQFVKNSNTLIAPIVSSGKAAMLICKIWDKKYERIPNFIVIEGFKAGGHLGFKKEDIKNHNIMCTEKILEEVLLEIKPYEEKYGEKIPVYVAGGIYDGKDIAYYIKRGASGVQMATRFILTEECDASEKYKKIMLNAKEEDIVIVESPVGMPGRALKSPLIQGIEEGKKFPAVICNGCIKECKKGENIPYCISKALIDAVNGNWETGLFFCGTNLGKIKKICTVKELLEELMNSYYQEM